MKSQFLMFKYMRTFCNFAPVSCNGTEHYLCVKKRKHSDETQQSECDAGSQDVSVTECKRKRISLSNGDDCSDPSTLPFTAYKDGESAENSGKEKSI